MGCISKAPAHPQNNLRSIFLGTSSLLQMPSTAILHSSQAAGTNCAIDQPRLSTSAAGMQMWTVEWPLRMPIGRGWCSIVTQQQPFLTSYCCCCFWAAALHTRPGGTWAALHMRSWGKGCTCLVATTGAGNTHRQQHGYVSVVLNPTYYCRCNLCEST